MSRRTDVPVSERQAAGAGTPRSPFERLITEASLAKLAGERSFARGAAYFESGSVVDLVQARGAVTARVIGGEEYRVLLRAAGRKLEWSCTCPLGEEGAFCKHAVAAGLAWLHRRSANDSSFGRTDEDELESARAHLAGQSKEALVEMVLEQAADEPELRAKLQAAALRHDPPSGLKALKEAVRHAFAVSRGFVDWRGRRAFLTRADSVAPLLHDLIEKGRAAEALSLADFALRRGIAAYQRCDDSGGGFGDLLRQIARLHLEACRAAKPEGSALGADLFALHRLDEWGFLEFENYAALLGTAGIERYRALAEKAWANVPALAPGERREADTERFLITYIMETLSKRDGNVEALVAIKSRDLSKPYAFFEIATLLANASRGDEALEWAERGWKTFRDEPNAQLGDFLIDAYAQRGRHEDAARVAWHEFARDPGMTDYRLLRKSAQGNGTWQTWREKALAHVRDELKKPRRSPGPWHWTAGGHSLLVLIFLDEGDTGAALAEAKAGGCTADLWMKIAEARASTHPQDAIEIYQARVDPIIVRGNNYAYDEAVQLIGKIGELMQGIGKEKEFGEWVAGVRVKHKAKRNFMKLLGRSSPI